MAQKAQLVIPMGHAQQINSIEVSHDFSLMASVDDSNIIHIWDTKSNREILQLNAHPSGIASIDFHPSKLELASTDQEGNVFIWDVLGDKVLSKIKTEESEPLVVYSPTGDQLWVGGKDLSIYSASGQLVNSVQSEGKITALNFAPYYNYIVTGTNSGSFIAYSPETLEQKYKIAHHSAKITTIETYDNTRSRIVFGHADGFATIINIENDKVAEHEKIFSEAVYKIIGNPENGRLIMVGADADEDVKFRLSSIEEDKSVRFKWSSEEIDGTGLKAITWADAEYDKVYLANHSNTIRIWSCKEEELFPTIIKGTARPIYDIDVDGAEEKLIIGSRHGQIKVIDLTGSHPLVLLRGNRGGGLIQLDFHPDDPIVLGAGRNEEINLWNAMSGETEETLKRQGYLDFNMQFTTERAFIRKVSGNNYEVFDYTNKNKEEIEVSDAHDMKISPDGTTMGFRRSSDIQLYHTYDLQLTETVSIGNFTDFDFTKNGILTIAGSTVKEYVNGKVSWEKNTMHVKDRIKVLDNGEFFLFSSENSRSQEFTAFHFDAKGNEIGTLEGHHDYITKILEVQDRILTSSLDGSIKIWKNENGKYQEVGVMIPLRLEDYVVVTPDDLFDATPVAMQEMHFTVGGEIIALEQLKESYYEPNLLPKLLGFGNSELRKPVNLAELGFAPAIELVQHPNVGKGILKAKILNKDGGIGRVTMTVNGKEVTSDLREVKNPDIKSIEIQYDLKGHPYLYDNKPSKISIRAYNKDGSVGSEPKDIFFLPMGDQHEVAKPRIYSLVIGTSDYADDEMDLKYAAKDAEDFASALNISSANLIGGENIEIKVLTTNQKKDSWPTKANIKKAFDDFAKKAKARDYLIVYMAGHGVNSGGEDGDFYYLTCTAKDGKVFNEETRKNHAISSYEFTEYIKSVPALNQVMIVDACHSGTLTSAFGKEKPVSKTMDSEEVRAYERMKDRTGIFLLAGSAADAVSYETTLYGQGLLTYALLFGMKGAALHEGEYIDVLDLFQFAAKKVPQLAEDIGGIQKPEVRVPTEASSFNIGKMTDADKAKIHLLQPKPVFVHAVFQESNNFNDPEGIGKALDKKLAKLGKSDNSPIIFMNEMHFSGALQVKGRYEHSGHLTTVNVQVFEDQRKRMEFKVEGVNANTISDKIMQRLLELIESS